MFRKVEIVILLFVACLSASAVPARWGRILLHQPDGTSFYATIKGDEFCKLLVAEDGSALTRSGDGFYNFAYYDAGGVKRNTGVHYGKDASPSVISASKQIPYDRLAEKAEASRASVSAAMPPTKASAGSKMKALIIPTEFNDLHFRYGASDFASFKDEVARYFFDQFGYAREFEFVIAPIVTLPESYTFYGANDATDKDFRAPEAVAAACRLSDSAVNFADFDNDGDGAVDLVFMLYAGPDEAEGAGDDYIWSHSWSLPGAGISLTLDGVRITRYAASSELMYFNGYFSRFTGIGSFCHEFCHVLGLRDLYDTDYEKSGGLSEGVWRTTSLMDGGLYNNDKRTPPSFNAIEREMLGIAIVKPMQPGEYQLAPISAGKEILRLDTDNPDEYYLFECRQNTGWDQYIGGSGLLVYHIDKSLNDAGYSAKFKMDLTAADRWENNEVNCNPDHMCAKVVAASEPFSSADISGIFFPGANGKYSYMKPFDGSSLSLDRITKNPSGDVSFTVSGSLYVDNVDVFQDAAIFGWHLENGLDNPLAKFSYAETGSQAQSYRVSSVGNNTYVYTLENLKPRTEYTFSISIPDGKGGEYVYKSTFTTAPVYEGTYPFIYLNRAERFISGAFKRGAKIPLRLYNSTNVDSVVWTFDGQRIEVDPSTGYYSLERSGRLVADIKYKDGSSELMIKEVTVK